MRMRALRSPTDLAFHLPPSAPLDAQFFSHIFPLDYAVHTNVRNVDIFGGKRPQVHSFFHAQR